MYEVVCSDSQERFKEEERTGTKKVLVLVPGSARYSTRYRVPLLIGSTVDQVVSGCAGWCLGGAGC